MNLSVGTAGRTGIESSKASLAAPGPRSLASPGNQIRSYWTSVFFVVVVVEVILRTTIGPLALVRVV